MSAPVQNNGNADDPGFYAPPRGREAPVAAPQQASAADAAPTPTEPGTSDAEGEPQQESKPVWPEAKPSARLPRGLGGPNIPMPVVTRRVRHTARAPIVDRAKAVGIRGGIQESVIPAGPPPSPQPAEFEAAKPNRDGQYQYPLPLNPDIPPEPLFGRQSLRWFATVAVAAAVVAGAVTFVSLPETRSPLFKRDIGPAVRQLVAGLPGSPQPTPRLIVEGRQTFANEALPLGVALKGATGSEFAFLTGLAAGTRLSVGGPYGNGWRIPVRELDGALAYAPKDFVGVMNAAIDLRLPNDLLVDSQALRLEWVVAKQPEARARPERPEQAKAAVVVRPLDSAEVNLFVRRGQDYLAMGDIVSARLVLRRAANAGSAQAALALGASFDPNVLTELGVLGFAPDPAQARAWYQRAVELGSAEAGRHIARLGN
jgi:hypothetical protein